MQKKEMSSDTDKGNVVKNTKNKGNVVNVLFAGSNAQFQITTYYGTIHFETKVYNEDIFTAIIARSNRFTVITYLT